MIRLAGGAQTPVGDPAHGLVAPRHAADQREIAAHRLRGDVETREIGRRQRLEAHAGLRQRRPARQHQRNAAPRGRRHQRLMLQRAVAVFDQHVAGQEIAHAEEYDDARAGGCPRRAAEGSQRGIDLRLLEADDEIVGTIARALLVVVRDARHAVVIAELADHRAGLPEIIVSLVEFRAQRPVRAAIPGR